MFYAVKKGRKPGIYESAEDCEMNVIAFPGAVYASFQKRKDAYAFAGLEVPEEEKEDAEVTKICQNEHISPAIRQGECQAYVDGSYNNVTHAFGYGGFLVGPKGKEIVQGYGNDGELASMRNVAGEICGAVAVVKKALELRYSSITIYYDYLGIEAWANGTWARNKASTKQYKEFMDKARKYIKIEFIKVKGHSGDSGNNEADKLARQAVGL